MGLQHTLGYTDLSQIRGLGVLAVSVAVRRTARVLLSRDFLAFADLLDDDVAIGPCNDALDLVDLVARYQHELLPGAPYGLVFLDHEPDWLGADGP